jgi:hypothetical protein
MRLGGIFGGEAPMQEFVCLQIRAGQGVLGVIPLREETRDAKDHAIQAVIEMMQPA